jgi:alanine racemase
VRAQEAAAASLVAAEAAIAVAKSKEGYELRSFNMTKMRVENEARAAKAAEEALQADSRATVIARKKIAAANQAKKLAESRAVEESLQLELAQ